MARAPFTPEVVRSVERAKAEYFTKRAQALIEQGRQIKVGRFGHATAFVWPEFNRVYGFGAEDLDRFDDLMDWYREEEQSPVFEVLPFRDNDAVFERLAATGFVQTSVQSVLAGESHPDLPKTADVRWIEPDELDAWARIYIQAYDWKLEGEEFVHELVAQYTGKPWKLCLAEIDGKPVGMGALWLGKDIAYLANAATLPDYRGRGVQKSVIALRLACAAQNGYETVASDCSPFGTSQRNLERSGLRLAAQKPRWRKPG